MAVKAQREIWLTPDEVRARLKLSKSKFYLELTVGGLPHAKLGRMIRIPESALEIWLESKRVT